MLRIFYLRNIYILPVLAIVIFYILPSILSLLFDSSENAAELLATSIVCIVVYLGAYKLFSDRLFDEKLASIKRIKLNWDLFSNLIIGLYFSIIIYASLTVSQVALFAALRGANISDLSVLREEFLRTRTGWEVILLYIYTICISAFMPLIITQKFHTASKYRFLLLFLFLFSLLLTLEKGRALVAMLPLIVYYINKGVRKQAYKAMAFLLITIIAVSFVARGGLTSSSDEDHIDSAASTPYEYNLFKGETGQFYYVINRVVYIPYITAIDWLRYKDEVLSGKAISGRSIGVIAWAMGEDKINLEREIFAFEWGQNETGTGSSNTVFYIDSYLNFGFYGVALYSIILAFIFRVCIFLGNEALIACLSISAYYVAFQGLSAVLFSGGLGFLFILALFFEIDRNQ